MQRDGYPPVHCACTHCSLGSHAAVPHQRYEQSAHWASSALQQLAAAARRGLPAVPAPASLLPVLLPGDAAVMLGWHSAYRGTDSAIRSDICLLPVIRAKW